MLCLLLYIHLNYIISILLIGDLLMANIYSDNGVWNF